MTVIGVIVVSCTLYGAACLIRTAWEIAGWICDDAMAAWRDRQS